jgi:5-methylcytosine-specific restriction endonuclease McrA
MRQLVEIAADMCCYCYKALGSDFHVDHIIPLSFGGTNNLSNLVLACPKCNLQAGDLVFASMQAKGAYIRGLRKPQSH